MHERGETFGRRIYAVEYQHRDGRDYRHEARPGSHLVGRPDGVVEIRSTRGPAWERRLQLSGERKAFLVNPAPSVGARTMKRRKKHKRLKARARHQRRAARHTSNRSRRRSTSPGRAVQRHSRKRPPPAGFASWSAYMASIRPRSRSAAAAAGPARGGRMARKKWRGGSRRAKHSRRTLSSNPSGMLRQLPAKAVEIGVRAVETVGGVWIARKGRGLFKQQPATIKGSAIEVGIAAAVLIAGAFAGPKVARHAEHVATGCLMAPIMSHIGQLQIANVSDALGDDGWVVGPGTGLTLISAFPEDYAGVAGDDDLGAWVSGPGRRVAAPVVAVAPTGRRPGLAGDGDAWDAAA